MEINGTLIWYYNICFREVWLMGHYIVPDQNNTNIDIGRYLHEESYKRNPKEIVFGNVRFDVLMKDDDGIVIGETKKSSRFSKASRWQLLYYLNLLHQSGINAKGVLLYPNEKKREEVILTIEKQKELENMINEIHNILNLAKPPKPVECKYCKKCGYEEYCWS